MIVLDEPFERAAKKLYLRWGRKLYGNRVEKLEEQLKRLKAGMSAEEYYIGLWKRVLKTAFLGILFLAAAAAFAVGRPRIQEIYRVKRPSYGEGSLETEMEALVEGEREAISVKVTVKERRYTEEEIHRLFDSYEQKLPQIILGENESLDQVQYPLKLPSVLENGTIEVKWFLEPSLYMDEQGEFQEEPPQNGALTELRAVLRYQEEEQEYRFFARLYPRKRTPLEELRRKLFEEAAEKEEEKPWAEKVTLPQDIDGKKVQWITPGIPVLPLGSLFLALLLWYLFTKEEKDIKKRLEFRNRQMIMDYPMILYKMSMLLGAGMTIQGAFRKIAFHYKEREGKEIRYAYEEMLNICCQMEKGVGEALAYEQFGQNCQDMHYIKFGSILSQNLKKGSKGLPELLLKEADQGMEERKNLARRMGEEAGVKLLLPMTLMLMIVMALLVVPSVLAF